MKILIVEDDFSFALSVEMLIDALGYQHLGTIDNGQSALESIDNNPPDLILMDIDLNGFLSGIDIARKIRAKNIPVVFMTTFNDEEVYKEAMITNPFGYIVKPFDELTLRSYIERVLNNSTKKESDPGLLSDSFFVKVNEVLKRIEYRDVCFIHSDRNYADIHLKDKRYTAKISLAKLSQRLDTDDLTRVHKQYIINLKKIESVSANDVFINGKPIPLGKKYRADFIEKLNKI